MYAVLVLVSLVVLGSARGVVAAELATPQIGQCRAASPLAKHVVWPGIYSLTTPMEAGDVDGDGDIDVVVTGTGAAIMWLANAHPALGFSGHGVIEAADTTSGNLRVAALVVADLTGNGVVDVAACSFVPLRAIVWYENRGGGEFARRRVLGTDSTVNFYPRILATDIDADGDLDLVWSLGDAGKFWWALNVDGRFPEVVMGASRRRTIVTMGDLDGDGQLELIYYQDGIGATPEAILYGSYGASGVQDEMTAFPISKLLSSMGAADIDGDGLDDVVLGTRSDWGVAWFRNNGASFSQMPSFTTRAVESRFIAADFDNDTDVDIEYVYRQSSSEARLVRAVNDGTGNFDVHEYVLPNRGGWSFVSVDINGDDVRDVIVALDSTMELIVSPSNVSDWITTGFLTSTAKSRLVR